MGVGVIVGVGVTVGVSVTVGVAVGVAVDVTVAVDVPVAVAVWVGVAVAKNGTGALQALNMETANTSGAYLHRAPNLGTCGSWKDVPPFPAMFAILRDTQTAINGTFDLWDRPTLARFWLRVLGQSR